MKEYEENTHPYNKILYSALFCCGLFRSLRKFAVKIMVQY